MKNKKVLIILIVVFVVLIAVLSAILYFATDLFKTEKQLFYKYLGKYSATNSELITQYSKVNEKILKNSQSSNTNLDIFTITKNKQTGIEDAQKMFTITSSALKNISSKQYYRDINIESTGKKILAFKYLQDDNTYGIMEDNIVIKYLAVENSNLKSLFSKMGVKDVTGIPDTIKFNPKETLETNREALMNLKQKYINIIYNHITEENFYKINNDDKTQTIGVSISEQEVMEMIKNILETVQNDTELLSLLSKNNVENIEPLKQYIQKLIKEKSNTEYSTEKDFIKLEFKKEGKKILTLSFEKNYKSSIYPGITNNTTSTSVNPVNNKITILFDLSKTNNLEVSLQHNDKELRKMIAYYVYDEEKIELNVKMINSAGTNETIDMKYKINGYKTENIREEYVIKLKPSFGTVEYKITINNETMLKENVSIPKLTSENSVKLNDYTSEQFESLFEALEKRIKKVYTEYYYELKEEQNKQMLEMAENAAKEYEENSKKEEDALKKLEEKLEKQYQ